MKNEKAELAPSLWLYAIHSKNADLIHLLEELHIKQTINDDNEEEVSYIECFNESIKCHHNAITYYFINNYLQTEDESSKETFIQSLEYYNFLLLQNELVDKSSFCHLCHFDYYTLVKDLSTRSDFDIDINCIRNHVIQNNSKLYHSIKFKIILFNEIQNRIIQYNSKSYHSIKFNIY